MEYLLRVKKDANVVAWGTGVLILIVMEYLLRERQSMNLRGEMNCLNPYCYGIPSQSAY